MRLWIAFSDSSKTVLIFPKNFLDLRSDTIEMQVIINLSGYSNKHYAIVVLNDSDGTISGEGKDAAIRPFRLYNIITK